ncbi:NADH-quinone oxidoreductase subunit J [Aliiroseovarius subalbicans]|uniref:NADH-quinone oxidoreductase subunit J n=1 Tax=Aliiroseovarius subalbicans TaxID=2925840 RepID=UPI001F5879E9|nr:NADH-quinone oxidoreductase subunit J [Aliiroseovarius subalbicans]MCI2398032.1 NADH-quinone oxidoreductase subunit J [Aliiroseovarius subalbicans]
MSVADFAFYVFAITTVASGLFTVVSKNPVHSVLWLIAAFLGATGLFVLLGAEFLAMILMIIYVGAVAILFLFVVMMLDVDFAELKAEMAKSIPVALLIGTVLLMQLGAVLGVWQFADGAEAARAAITPAVEEIHNTAALGQILYTDYILLFQMAGLILLVAMIGAIVLTMRHRTNVKRQNVIAQMHRDPAAAMELKDVKPGQGL